MSYKIRYEILEANSILNFLGPVRRPTGWTQEIIDARKKELERQMGRHSTKHFFQKLEDSILEEGIRNPILVVSGLFSEKFKKANPKYKFKESLEKIPPEKRQFLDTLVICESIGGCRLFVAQNHSMVIPCIISDFNDQFVNSKTLYSVEEVRTYFKDKPKKIYFSRSAGILTTQLPHTHLK